MPMMRGLGVGTHFGRGPNWDVDTILPLVRQMGVSVIRDGPEWAGIERAKGVYAIPDGCQHMFDVVSKSGIRIILPLFRRNDLYENPLDPDAFARYAAFMVKTWKAPEICAYEVWNEPPNFDFPQQYKDKTLLIAKYGEMVRKAAAAIRAVNPNAVILENLEAGQWLQAIRDQAADYAQVDGIDLHPYPMRYPAETSPWNPPVTDARHSLVSYLTIQATDYPKKYLGHELQMWVGEYGFPTMPKGGAQWAGVTDEAQAAYEVRGLLTGLHAGVKVWCMYDMVNEGSNPADSEDNMGLVRDIAHHHQPKPAYYALQRVARLMGPDWQIASAVTASVDVTLAPEPEDKHVQVAGPQALWFRVGRDYITFVWKAGWFSANPQVPLGTITWTKAPADVTGATAQDLTTGQTQDVKLTREGATLTLSGIPVGSVPVAIHWTTGK